MNTSIAAKRRTDPSTGRVVHQNCITLVRSTTMYSMHEALARERMRELLAKSQESREAHELVAQRRRHRVISLRTARSRSTGRGGRLAVQ